MEDPGVASGKDLASRVYEMVRAYVMRKTESRSQISWQSFRESRDEKGRVKAPEPYREARHKVCMDAFLAMRSRRSREEFRDYFIGSICSVPQYLPEEDYQAVASALGSDGWEELRSLAMLAMSAHARV
jgi:CRISPR-associated protein Cmx8